MTTFNQAFTTRQAGGGGNRNKNKRNQGGRNKWKNNRGGKKHWGSSNTMWVDGGGGSNSSSVNPLPEPPSPVRRRPAQRCTPLQSGVPVPKPLSRSANPSTKRSRHVSFVDSLPRLPSPSPVRGRRPSNNTKSSDPVQIRNDRLGTLVRNLSQSLHDAGSWEDFLRSFKDRSYLSPSVGDIDHPAAKLLQRWREDGVPVNTSSPPWSSDQKD